MAKIHTLTCDPACGFHLETHNEKEAVRMGMEHATDAHPNMKVTIADMKKMINTR